MEQTYMKEKPILPLLLSMALPMVLSMMVNSLYNIIDSYFVAKINENAMTALSLVFPVQNLITAVGVGFGIGINATIAYFLGAQKQEEADTSATLGIACSFLHGVILTIGTITIMPAFLSMFTKEQEILSMGITYSRITFGFSVIISLGVAYEKIFQSVGTDEDHNVLYDEWMYSEHYSGSDHDFRTRTGSPDGNPGCRMGDRAWTAAYAGSVSAFRMDPSSADKDFSEISEI